MQPLPIRLATIVAASLSWLGPLAAAMPVTFADLYTSAEGVTATSERLAGSEIELAGFMAPPLKANADFFVLTLVPLAICPFCDSEATWPEDIVVVETGQRFDAVRYDQPIRVRGRLDIGFAVDKETGFGSLIRIVDASFGRY